MLRSSTSLIELRCGSIVAEAEDVVQLLDSERQQVLRNTGSDRMQGSVWSASVGDNYGSPS